MNSLAKFLLIWPIYIRYICMPYKNSFLDYWKVKVEYANDKQSEVNCNYKFIYVLLIICTRYKKSCHNLSYYNQCKVVTFVFQGNDRTKCISCWGKSDIKQVAFLHDYLVEMTAKNCLNYYLNNYRFISLVIQLYGGLIK